MTSQTPTLEEFAESIAEHVGSKLGSKIGSAGNELILKELKKISSLLTPAKRTSLTKNSGIPVLVQEEPSKGKDQKQLAEIKPTETQGIRKSLTTPSASEEKSETKKENSSPASLFFDNVKSLPKILEDKIFSGIQNAAFKLIPKSIVAKVNSVVSPEKKPEVSKQPDTKPLFESIKDLTKNLPSFLKDIPKKLEERKDRIKTGIAPIMERATQSKPIQFLTEKVTKTREGFEKYKDRFVEGTKSFIPPNKEKTTTDSKPLYESIKELIKSFPSFLKDIPKKLEERKDRTKAGITSLTERVIQSRPGQFLTEKASEAKKGFEKYKEQFVEGVKSFIPTKTGTAIAEKAASSKEKESKPDAPKSLLEEKKETQKVEVVNFKEITDILPKALKDLSKEVTKELKEITKILKTLPRLLQNLQGNGGMGGGGMVDNLLDLFDSKTKGGKSSLGRRLGKTALGRFARRGNIALKRTLPRGIKSLASKVKAPGAASAIGKLGKVGKVGGVLGLLAAGADFAGRKEEGQTTTQAAAGTAGGVAGGALGAWGGAAAGAAIGSVVPIVGTAVGGVIGGIVGGFGGSWLGGKAADKITGVGKPEESKLSFNELVKTNKPFAEVVAELESKKDIISLKYLKSLKGKQLQDVIPRGSGETAIDIAVDKIAKKAHLEEKSKAPAITPEPVKEAVDGKNNPVEKNNMIEGGGIGNIPSQSSMEESKAPAITPEPVKEAVENKAEESRPKTGAQQVIEHSQKRKEKINEWVEKGYRNLNDIPKPELDAYVEEFRPKSLPKNVAVSGVKKSLALNLTAMGADPDIKFNKNTTSSNTEAEKITPAIEPTSDASSNIAPVTEKSVGKGDKYLESIANNTENTNRTLANLVAGFNNMAKALESVGISIAKQSPTVINAGQQNTPSIRRPGAANAVSGNSTITNFRKMTVEAARFQPA